MIPRNSPYLAQERIGQAIMLSACRTVSQARVLVFAISLVLVLVLAKYYIHRSRRGSVFSYTFAALTLKGIFDVSILVSAFLETDSDLNSSETQPTKDPLP
jgi:type IV secretory pathway TrbF-like protein